jgi:hypothetical protein
MDGEITLYKKGVIKMKDVLALQKMNKTKQKGKGQNPAKSSISLGCSPSSNTSWFFC